MTIIESAQYAVPDSSQIDIVVNGDVVRINAVPGLKWFDEIVANGITVAPYAATADDFARAIQEHMDATSKARGYADGVALAGYSTSTIPAWASEAQTFVAWRDQVWIYAYTELAKVQGGQRQIPTIRGLIAELPVIVWPQ